MDKAGFHNRRRLNFNWEHISINLVFPDTKKQINFPKVLQATNRHIDSGNVETAPKQVPKCVGSSYLSLKSKSPVIKQIVLDNNPRIGIITENWQTPDIHGSKLSQTGCTSTGRNSAGEVLEMRSSNTKTAAIRGMMRFH